MNRGLSKRCVGARCGVYQIICDHGVYIGASNDVANRYTHHRFRLRRNVHSCKKLQEAWNTLGEEAFRFELIHPCNPEDLDVLEQKYLDELDNLLNTSRFVSGKHEISEASRLKRSLVHRDHTRSIGSKNPAAKISEETVREIRNLHGEIRQKEIAKRYNLGLSTVEKILSRKLWSHV